MRLIYGNERPSELFKYRSLANSEQREWLSQTLLSDRAYWPTPDEFNDPFDCAPIYRPLVGQELLDNARQVIKRVNPSLNRRARLARERALINTPPSELVERVSATRATMRETAVYSLGSDATNILMGSHYASSHRGVCLRFNSEAFYNFYTSRGILLLPVLYSEDRPIIVIGNEDHRKLIQKAFLVKAPCWSYESEWRIIDYRGRAGLRALPPDALSGLILGAEVSQEDEEYVRLLVRKRSRPLKIHRAVLDSQQYKMELRAD